AVSFSRFGTGGYLERTADLSAGIACGALFSCGVKAHACSLTIGGDLPSRFTLYDADLSARFEPFPLMSFAAFQKNIGSFINPDRRDILFPETAFGVTMSPARGIFISYNYNRTFYGGVNSLSCRLYLLSCFMVGGGYSRECGRYAVESAVLYRGVKVSYAWAWHPYLGITHSAGVSFSPSAGIYRPVDISSMKYAESAQEEIVVDITLCSAQELSHAAEIDEEKAERIIRVRQMFGSVSEKSLTQMGLTSEEKDSVKKHTTGLVSDEDAKKDKARSREKEKAVWVHKKQEQKKDLFLRLVDEGIPAAKALEISRMAQRMNTAELMREINGSAKFTQSEKERIAAVCGK
ncbi:MAG: hypothetical protein ACRCUT_01505, partial [Spirochaetota bacterium]